MTREADILELLGSNAPTIYQVVEEADKAILLSYDQLDDEQLVTVIRSCFSLLAQRSLGQMPSLEVWSHAVRRLADTFAESIHE